jgi:hypothetical protein
MEAPGAEMLTGMQIRGIAILRSESEAWVDECERLVQRTKTGNFDSPIWISNNERK